MRRASRNSIMNGEKIIAIDAKGWNSISNSFRSYAIRSKLRSTGSGNGIAIIAAEKDRRGFSHGSKIQACMKIPLRRCSFAKIANRHAGFSLHFHGIGTSGSMRNFRSDRRRDCDDILNVRRTKMVRHLPAQRRSSAYAKHMVEILLNGKSSPKHHCRLPDIADTSNLPCPRQPRLRLRMLLRPSALMAKVITPCR